MGLSLKKFGSWVKSNIKSIATVAAIVYPPLIPSIGTSLGFSGAAATVAGAAALSGAASAVAGDKPADILKNAAIGGVTAGVTEAVSGSGLFGGAADSGVIPAGTSAGGTAPVEFSPQQLSELSGQVASQGLIPSVLSSISKFTGLSTDTLGKLGVAGVQALLSSAGASQIAKQGKEAAQTQADAQIRAAQIAADATKFRPVGVTTRFGQSAFTTDAQGNVTGAGYTATPEIVGYQNRLSALAEKGLTQAEQAQAAYAPLQAGAQSLFGLGQNYLGSNLGQPLTDMSKTYMASQAGQPLTSMGQTYMNSQVGQPLTSMGQTYMNSQVGQPLTNLGQSYINSQAGQPLTSMGQAYMASQAGQPLTSMGQAYMASQAGQPLITLGSNYLKQTPEQVAADYIAKQQALLAPTQENQLALLQNKLQQQGRTGLSVAQGGNLRATTPEMQAYYNALAQSNLQLSANANAAGQQQAQFGAGLLSQGLGLTQGQQLAGAGLYGQGAALTQNQQLAGAGLYGQGVGLTQGQQLAGANLYSQGTNLTQGQQLAGANLYSQGTNLTQGQQLAGANLYSQGTNLTQAQQLAGANLYGQGINLTQQGQQFGGGLMSQGAGLLNAYYTGQTGAYAPFTTAMDTTIGLENLAQQPMTLGTQIGAKTTASAAQAGGLLSKGITDAAKIMYPSNAFSASGNVLSGLSNSPGVASGLNSLFGIKTYTFNPTTSQLVPV